MNPIPQVLSNSLIRFPLIKLLSLALASLALASGCVAATKPAPAAPAPSAPPAAATMTLQWENPVWSGYLADPHVLHASDGFYYAYGTGLRDDWHLNKGELPYENHIPVIRSKDLQKWELVGGALPEEEGLPLKRRWAPEVAEKDGQFYLYYSGDMKIRVAGSDHPAGPFKDLGKVLLPAIGFNIDGHPYRDPVSGQWYLFLAKKFKFGEQRGTGLAVVKLNDDMVSVEGPVIPITREFRDWQLFNPQEGDFCVEGATVVHKDGKYWCFYSGGNWQTPTYGVGCLVADAITGPYHDPWSLERGSVVCTIPDKLIGPGHNSVILGPDGKTYFMIYHSWNSERTARQMCLDPLVWTDQGPKVVNPGRGPKTVTLPLPADAR